MAIKLLMSMILCCSSSFAWASDPTLDEALEIWELKMFQTIDRDFPYHGRHYPRSRLEQMKYKLKIRSLAANLDWIVTVELLQRGLISIPPNESMLRKLDSSKITVLWYLSDSLLRELLEVCDKNGMNLRFGGQPLPGTNIMTLIQAKLEADACETKLSALRH